jgi:NADH:ubiquinone oxidoreductase subunit E
MTLEARKAKMEAKARKRARREEKQREDREWKRVQREMARKKDEALLSALESVQQQNVAISGLLNKMADKFM